MTIRDNNHAKLMKSLLDKQQLIADVIGNRKVSYIDVPLYRNVGDLLIMRGTLAFFERYRIKVRYKANWFNVAKNCIHRDDAVVFQGGGNMGDLYGGCQVVREKLIPELKDQRVIILPQTIFFEKYENYIKCCDKFRQHQDLHIFVRDQESYDLALQMTDYVYLMPDMAHQLYPIAKPKFINNRRSRLALMRVDKEMQSDRSTPNADVITDWNLMFEKSNHIMVFVMRAMRVGALLGINRLPGSLGTEFGILLTNYLVRRAIYLFSRFENVITDRLHGHILSCLLDIPNEVLDNSYGKNSHYVSLWTGESDLVTFDIKGRS